MSLLHNAVEIRSWSDHATQAFGSASFVMGEIFASNPFMDTFDNVVDLVEGMKDADTLPRAVERYTQGQVDKFVPNILRKANEAVEGGYSYEGDTLFDRFTRNVTFLSDDNFDLDVRRNPVTGEAIQKRTPGTSLAPVDETEFNDPVSEMLYEAYQATGKTFELKKPWGWPDLQRGTDLRALRSDDDSRSLYDEYLGLVANMEAEVNKVVGGVNVQGKTYRQALEVLATNPEFRAAPWGNRTDVRQNAKGEAIMALKRFYEQAATDAIKQSDAFQNDARQRKLYEHLMRVDQ